MMGTTTEDYTRIEKLGEGQWGFLFGGE